MKKKYNVYFKAFNDAEKIKMSVYAFFKNENCNDIDTFYILCNKKEELICNCINNLSKKYDKINIIYCEENEWINDVVINQKKNNTKHFLVMDGNIIITKNCVGRLISILEKNSDSGYIVPVSNNGLNCAFQLPKNYTFVQTDGLLSANFSFDCIKAYTIDYNFVIFDNSLINVLKENNSLNKNNVRGLISLGTYVFNLCSINNLKNTKVNNYLKDNIDYNKFENNYKFVTYLVTIAPGSGGVYIAVDMINYLIINGINCNILYNDNVGYNGPMLFNPIYLDDIEKCNVELIMSTIYFSVFFAKEIADKKKIPLLYFAQGYEPYFNNAIDYGAAELSYKIADHILCVSNYLKQCYKENFNVESSKILNGVNTDILYKERTISKITKILFILRGNDIKGDFILIDIIKKIINNYHDLQIDVICNNRNVLLPLNNNDTIKINVINGPLKRTEIAEMLQKTDVYIDASLTEGFGLTSLEAMAGGAVVICSDAGGNMDYAIDNENCLVVQKVNDSDAYINKLDLLLKKQVNINVLRKNAFKTSLTFDFDNTIENYIHFFNSSFKKKKINLTFSEKEIFDGVLERRFKKFNKSKFKSAIRKVGKKIPKKFRSFIKKIINKLYSFVNYE